MGSFDQYLGSLPKELRDRLNHELVQEGTNDIADGAVTEAKLADAAVTTDKLVDAAVTTDKLVDGAVTAAKLSNPVVTGVKTGDYVAAAGETVRVNPSGGAFNVDLPALTGSGRDVTVANVTSSATAVTLRGKVTGAAPTTTGDMNAAGGPGVANVLTNCPSTAGFSDGMAVTVAGAGLAGGDLVSSIDLGGVGLNTLTLTGLASTSVVGALCTGTATRDHIDAAETVSLAAAWRAIVVRDLGSIWKKISLF